ncbi:MAG: TadE/TadG family type IV pilus assembly protein [Planctomycetota bacterium]
MPRRLGLRAAGGRSLRSAVATVELAICLPVLSLVVFGSIQATNLIFLQHAVTAAAYEGSLELAKSNSTSATVTARVQQVLDAREVVRSTIAIVPTNADVSTLPPGSIVTIVVRANVRANSTVLGFFASQNRVTARLVATR